MFEKIKNSVQVHVLIDNGFAVWQTVIMFATVQNAK